jgi:ferric enterobactin receptor
MLFRSFCLSIGLMFVFSMSAQRPGGGGMTPVVITGTIIDKSTQSGVEFASVSIMRADDNTIIGGGLTDQTGNFTIDSRPGKCILVVEFLGFDKITRPLDVRPGLAKMEIGSIEISPSAQLLEQVEVTAEKSETVFALDKKIFNVGQDLANRGGTAVDLLDNVPSVTVDVEGNVSLRGSGNVRILIDGKPSGLVGLTGSGGLKSIPANLIERVEVITNPSAKYEAEGMTGIINIVLRKDSKKGLNGSFEVSGGYPWTSSASANLNYRFKKVNFFGNYNLNYGKGPSKGYNYTEVYRGDTTFSTYTNRKGDRLRLSNSVRLGTEIYIDEKQTLTMSGLYRYSRSENTAPIRYYDDVFNQGESRGKDLVQRQNYLSRVETELETAPTYEGSIDYIKRFNKNGKELRALFQYTSNPEVEKSDYTIQNFVDNLAQGNLDKQRADNTEEQSSKIFQVDYTHPSVKGKFETGVRASIRDIGNQYLVEDFLGDAWKRVDGLSNHFIYDENVYAAYAIYGQKIKQFSYQGGLRYEYSDINTRLLETGQINPRKYSNLFPSGSINYAFKGENQLQLSYSRRIQRPRFMELNPFFTFADIINFFTGNPNLNPEFTNSFEFNHIKYWKKGNFGSTIFWRHTTDIIQRVTQLQPDGTNLTLPLNLSTGDNMGIEFLYAYEPIKWLRIDGNLNLFRQIIEGSYEGRDLGADSYSWFARVGGRATFWKNADLQLRLNYRAPVDIPQGRQFAQYVVDLAFSKDFLKNNEATFTLAWRDIFNQRRRNSEVFGEGFYQRNDFQFRRSPIVATFAYRLNSKKEKKRSQREGGGDMEEF